MDGEREQVAVAEAAPDLGALGGAGATDLGVRRAEGLQQPEVAALRAVAILEQPLRPGEPAAGPARLAARRPDQPEPERAPHGALHLARREVRVMRALEHVEVLELLAEHEGGGRQPLQVLAAELSRHRQRGVGVLPRPSCEGLPAALHVIGGVHPPVS